MKKVVKYWSEVDNTAKDFLFPELEWKNWNSLSRDEKSKIWQYLRNKGWFVESIEVIRIIILLNERFKKTSYAKKWLEHSGGSHYEFTRLGGREIKECCLRIAYEDFEYIFLEEDESVVYEVITYFADELVDYYYLENNLSESDEGKKKENNRLAFEKLDAFSLVINDVFEQFGINIVLTRHALVPRQDKKVMEKVYEPVLSVLADSFKWKECNKELVKAFTSFNKRTEDGYEATIRHSYSAIQSFLQIIVKGKIGKGKMIDLIKEAKKRGLIPDDGFSEKFFKDAESYIVIERQKRGGAHPQKEYASEANALLVLNVCMIFIQHCFGSGKI